MVKRELVAREYGAAVLALELVPKEEVSAGEQRLRTRRVPDVPLEDDHRRQLHLKGRRAHGHVVLRNNGHGAAEDRADAVLPGPERKWQVRERLVVGVQDERRVAASRYPLAWLRRRQNLCLQRRGLTIRSVLMPAMRMQDGRW